jgi:solute carrier family 25 uncoupling protein 8/9
VLSRNFLGDNLGCHFFCGFSAGFVAVIVGSPVDVMKTRIMNASPEAAYNGVLDCFSRTLKQEGFGAFYSGFYANFLRIVSWNIVMFIALEQIKAGVQNRFYHD